MVVFPWYSWSLSSSVDHEEGREPRWNGVSSDRALFKKCHAWRISFRLAFSAARADSGVGSGEFSAWLLSWIVSKDEGMGMRSEDECDDEGIIAFAK